MTVRRPGNVAGQGQDTDVRWSLKARELWRPAGVPAPAESMRAFLHLFVHPALSGWADAHLGEAGPSLSLWIQVLISSSNAQK